MHSFKNEVVTKDIKCKYGKRYHIDEVYGVAFQIEPEDREPTIAESALYMIDEDGIEYYCCGNTRIKITESFPEKGPSMNELLTDLIIREAKKDS